MDFAIPSPTLSCASLESNLDTCKLGNTNCRCFTTSPEHKWHYLRGWKRILLNHLYLPLPNKLQNLNALDNAECNASGERAVQCCRTSLTLSTYQLNRVLQWQWLGVLRFNICQDQNVLKCIFHGTNLIGKLRRPWLQLLESGLCFVPRKFI